MCIYHNIYVSNINSCDKYTPTLLLLRYNKDEEFIDYKQYFLTNEDIEWKKQFKKGLEFTTIKT